MNTSSIQLGLKENKGQFALLVLVNAFVGAMIGMERSILPAIAEQEFQMVARTAILSFIVVFGISKALTNYLAGHFSDHYGRKAILVFGWLVATPVPFLLMWSPSWSWILFANLLLGVSQGLTWSTTVIMKIDLVGPQKRGFAMGLNEFAGYLAVALSALATGWIAANVGLRPHPFSLGIAFVLLGGGLSIFVIRETKHYVVHEASLLQKEKDAEVSSREIFWRTTWGDRDLSSVSQAGLVNNLNDGMAWGLFPLVFAASKMSLSQIGTLAAIYPMVWGITQLFTGAWSDRIGRKRLIVGGMWVQAVGIAIIAWVSSFVWFAVGAVFLGIGTAMVYPTLLAAIGDVAHPRWRASSVGVYRFWRDMGYAVGALLAGVVADLFGLLSATLVVAVITFVSGVVVAVRMRETLQKPAESANKVIDCIPPSELFKQSEAVILDVRLPDEYDASHVDGAINIPLDALVEQAKSFQRKQPIVTVCGKGGGRSEKAAEILRGLGFVSVRSLCGGTLAWKEEYHRLHC